MKISEFATCTGLSKDTIRYYEKMNLLFPKVVNKHREYSEQDVEIIETILKLKQAGFTLQEIHLLFSWSRNTDQTKQLSEEEIQNLERIQVAFQNKYEQMVQKEEQIKEIKNVLLQANNKMSQLLERNKGM